jgi:hypothetical protein
MNTVHSSPVVFVGGYGRSGSTLVDLLLNRVPGIVAVGELRHAFGRALGDNELCSCGRPFRNCPFWSEVLASAFPNGADRERIHEAMKAINRVVATPGLLSQRLMGTSMRAHAEVYDHAFSALYASILKVSGAQIVVDSSKYPAHGLFLRTCRSIALSAMLLVRDPRAVAHSWQRRRLRPEVHWERREMPRHSVIRSALAWSASNALTSLLDDGATPFRVQRYEDLTENPVEVIAEIASFVLGRTTPPDLRLFEERSVESHSIAGNPLRLAGERLEVKRDVAWRTEMSRAKQVVVAAICFRQMRKYGYPVAPQKATKL